MIARFRSLTEEGYKLKDLCDKFGFSLGELVTNQTVFIDQPYGAVTDEAKYLIKKILLDKVLLLLSN